MRSQMANVRKYTGRSQLKLPIELRSHTLRRWKYEGKEKCPGNQNEGLKGAEFHVNLQISILPQLAALQAVVLRVTTLIHKGTAKLCNLIARSAAKSSLFA